MKQQFAPRPPRSQQRMQNIQIALHTGRTWFLSIVISLVLLFLIGSTLFAVNQLLLHISRFFLLFTISGILLSLIVFLVVFLSVLLWAVLTAKRRAIGAYCKAVRRSLEQSMRSYYHPENAPDLSQEQEQHLLLLGLPGSGKTKTLENFLYQAVTHPSLRKDKWIPILIQMKYYNGFLRQYPLDALADTQAAIPRETLLAYLLDDKHQQSAQATKEPELPGIHHLRLYLRQFIEQGRIVFLCDGMNELESHALQTVHNELIDLMQTPNRVIMTCRELEYQEQPLLHDFTDQGATPKTLPALSEGDVPHIAERYLQSQADELKGKSRQAAISQIPETQNLILRINRPHRYTSPFMLIRLIEALKQLDEGQAQTISRGRLLQTSVNQNLLGKDAQAVRRFLSLVAYTARRNEQRNAIQLGSNRRPISLTGFAENLNDWLKQEADDVIYTSSDIRKLLVIAENAGLVTISNYGTLSFIHELIAEYFAAEYLSYIYHEKRNSDSFWADLYESEANAPGIWSEPVALWAGLEEEPMDVATFLIQWAQHYNHQRTENDKLYYHALALSLTCLGVKPPDPLPQIIWR
ncbi:MAG TPA: hypothetical protein VFA10_25590, partial [Ktedonobacteraceae bacterium]|nr:hypothetical protein [Ktedonobacteraceae bacterium]